MDYLDDFWESISLGSRSGLRGLGRGISRRLWAIRGLATGRLLWTSGCLWTRSRLLTGGRLHTSSRLRVSG